MENNLKKYQSLIVPVLGIKADTPDELFPEHYQPFLPGRVIPLLLYSESATNAIAYAFDKNSLIMVAQKLTDEDPPNITSISHCGILSSFHSPIEKQPCRGSLIALFGEKRAIIIEQLPSSNCLVVKVRIAEEDEKFEPLYLNSVQRLPSHL